MLHPFFNLRMCILFYAVSFTDLFSFECAAAGFRRNDRIFSVNDNVRCFTPLGIIVDTFYSLTAYIRVTLRLLHGALYSGFLLNKCIAVCRAAFICPFPFNSYCCSCASQSFIKVAICYRTFNFRHGISCMIYLKLNTSILSFHRWFFLVYPKDV